MIIPCKFRRIFRPVWLKLPSTPFCLVEIILHTLLYGWNYPARPPVRLKLSCTPSCTFEIILHALLYGWNYPAHPLYGWNYPARPEGAEALSPGQRPGYKAISNAPCKGKSFKIHLIKIENPLRYVKLLPLQGVSCISLIPRALPWAKSFCPFRACCWVFLAFWACCCGLLGHFRALLLWTFRPSPVLETCKL